MANKGRDATVIVGGGHHPPYQRPPLSKDYLAGKTGRESLYLKPRSVYENAGHRLRLGERVERIDRVNKTVELSDQSTLGYDRLVLATGARVRRLNAPGADLEGILSRQAP